MRYITAYYFVEEVMDINKAREDSTIVTKYNNPHLRSVQYHRDNEVIVFGNPIKSLILQIPLEINKALLRELNIPFNPSKNQTELAAISSRLRNWVRLDANQADLLRKKIDDLNQKSYLKNENCFQMMKSAKYWNEISNNLLRKIRRFWEKICAL